MRRSVVTAPYCFGWLGASADQLWSHDPADTTVSWTHPQLNQLAAFEVVVENVTSGVLTATFTLLASATTVHIAPEALTGPGKKYKVEVIAIAKNGNKTIVEVPFSTQ